MAVARPMLLRSLADLVVLAHLAFVAFAVLGGLAALNWRVVRRRMRARS